MTDAELKGIAAQAFNMAKRDMEQKKSLSFPALIAEYMEGRGLRRWKELESIIVERLGEDWPNSGRKKDIVFALLRMGVVQMQPEAVIFGSVVNQFTPTAQMAALPAEKRKELTDRANRGLDEVHQLVKEGYLEARDALWIVAQTATRVCMHTQPLRGEEPAQSSLLDPQDCDGRLKFYGVTHEQALQELTEAMQS